MDYRKAYSEMHRKGKYFPGHSIGPYVDAIGKLVALKGPENLLDYGCGRGMQYLASRVHERWGGVLPHCYDIGVNGLDTKPEGTFGGVICTDVLEHIEEPDVLPMLQELLQFVCPGGFLFLAISCRPSRKKFPDGRDLHVTVKPPSWWKNMIAACAPEGTRCRTVAVHFDVAGHFQECDESWETLL